MRQKTAPRHIVEEMATYDRLPPSVRRAVATANLQWRPSVVAWMLRTKPEQRVIAEVRGQA